MSIMNLSSFLNTHLSWFIFYQSLHLIPDSIVQIVLTMEAAIKNRNLLTFYNVMQGTNSHIPLIFHSHIHNITISHHMPAELDFLEIVSSNYDIHFLTNTIKDSLPKTYTWPKMGLSNFCIWKIERELINTLHIEMCNFENWHYLYFFYSKLVHNAKYFQQAFVFVLFKQNSFNKIFTSYPNPFSEWSQLI